MKAQPSHELFGMSPEQVCDELGRLTAHTQRPTEQVAHERVWQNVESRLVARSRRQDRMRGWTRVALVALALAGLWVFVRPLVWAPALEYTLEGGEFGESHFVRPSQTGALLRFSDGSEVRIDARARSRIAEVDAGGARVALEDGKLGLSVVHQPKTRWAVHAGPFTIAVIGTEFDVDWNASVGELKIAVHEGTVTVRGPVSGDLSTVRGGHELIARLKDNSVQIRAVSNVVHRPPQPTTVQPPPNVKQVPNTTDRRKAETIGTDGARPTQSRASGTRRSWAEHVGSGNWSEVLTQANAMGFEHALRSSSQGELSALADAARYAGQGDLARRAWLEQRRRFAGSTQARDAAFFLGRAKDDAGDRGGARRWFDTYLEESPSGAYAAEALGRKMVLVQRGRGTQAAEALARRYLQMFPKGTYARQAEEILSASSR